MNNVDYTHHDTTTWNSSYSTNDNDTNSKFDNTAISLYMRKDAILKLKSYISVCAKNISQLLSDNMGNLTMLKGGDDMYVSLDIVRSIIDKYVKEKPEEESNKTVSKGYTIIKPEDIKDIYNLVQNSLNHTSSMELLQLTEDEFWKKIRNNFMEAKLNVGAEPYK